MNKIVVLGSIIVDMSINVDRHPSIGETVIGKNLHYSPGGKGANQAVSASRLGANTHLISMVGDDSNGKMCVDFLVENNIGCHFVFKNEKLPTGIATIIVSEKTANNNIVVFTGANNGLQYEFIENEPYEKDDIIVAQFETPIETTLKVFKEGKKRGTLNILNPAPMIDFDTDLLNYVDILILNETELKECAKMPIKNQDTETALRKLQSLYGDKIYIATLGAFGVVALYKDQCIDVLSHSVNAIDTTGAGDCFVGAIAAYFLKNKPETIENFKNALDFANKAASISVTRKGSGISMPYLSEI